MTPSEAKRVIDCIDEAVDQILSLEIETDTLILEPLYLSQQLIFDSFSGDDYEELNSMFEREAVYEVDDEIFEENYIDV